MLTCTKSENSIQNKCNVFDVLIFLVGLAHSKGKKKDLSKFREINYQTLYNLLSSLSKNNKTPRKIIFASTISVYGEKYHQNIYSEALVPKPFSPYAVTKLEAEQYLLKNYSNKSWILRFAPVYSSSFKLNLNRRTKIFNNLYRAGNGGYKLSLCNVKNINSIVTYKSSDYGEFNKIIQTKNDKTQNRGVGGLAETLEYINKKLLLNNNVSILSGDITFEDSKTFNSVVLFNSDGILDVYKKQYPVPLAEQVPLSDIFPKLKNFSGFPNLLASIVIGVLGKESHGDTCN